MKPEACIHPPPAFTVSRETSDRLALLTALLQKWSDTLNLVSRRDLPHLWDRHIADSLQLAPLVPSNGVVADIGSGAGFPGLVLAIATSRSFHLIEADQRKAAFLREAARVTDAPVTIHAARIEAVQLPKLHLITARALAPLPQLCAWCEPLLAPDGACLFLKGANVDAELTLAAADWHMRLQRWRSRTNPGAAILQISELSRHARHQR